MMLDVLFCANTAYFQHVAVACASIAAHTPGATVHLVTCDQDPEAEAKLRRGAEALSGLSLAIYHVSEAALSSFFVDSYLTRECYLRLLAPDLLPGHVRRILYLDCDVVALGDLRPLAALDLGGSVVGAVPDYPRVPYVVDTRRLGALGIPDDHVYVNSGVLLMDLEAWRREGLTRRFVEFIKARGAQLAFHDQDAINAVLHDRIHLLDCRWNLQSRMYLCGRRFHPIEYEATREARRNPAILHYVGAAKPWKFRARTARKGEYFRYLARTEWRDARPPLTTPWQRAEYAFDRALSRLGIDYLEVLVRLRRAPARLASIALAPLRRLGPGSATVAERR